MKECVFTKLIFLLLLLSGNKFFRFVNGRSSADAADDAELDGPLLGRKLFSGHFYLRHAARRGLPRHWKFDMDVCSWNRPRRGRLIGEIALYNVMERIGGYAGRIVFYEQTGEDRELLAVHGVILRRTGGKLIGQSVPIPESVSSRGFPVDCICYELKISRDNLSLVGSYEMEGKVSGKILAVKKL